MAQSMAEHLIQRGKMQGIEQGIKQGIEQGVKLGIERGIKLGIEQGLKQGREQWETGAKRAAILKLLRLRFDGVPDSLANEISSIDDFSLLDSLFEQAATASTLDEINLQNHGGPKLG